MRLRLLRRLLPSLLPSKCGAPALARVCGGLCKNSPFEIYRGLSTRGATRNAIDTLPRRSLKRPRRAGMKQSKLLSRLNFSPNSLPSRRRTRDAADGLDRHPSPPTALSERSGGAGSPCVAEIGVRRPCLPLPAPAHSSDSSAKQASTRSQAAAKIRNSVAFTTGLTWVFSR